MKSTKFLIIDSGYFYAGIEIGVKAAPIIKYMLRWDEQRIKDYCKKKGWKVCEAN